jgi:ABC-2 type transport system permease protein
MVDRDGQFGAAHNSPGHMSSARSVRLGFGGVLRSEWIKLFTLRSTWWILAATIVVNLAICALLGASLAYSEHIIRHPQPGMPVPTVNGQPMTVDPGSFGLLSSLVGQACSMLGQLVFVVLSILIITNEYSSGMIRSTFTIAPRRDLVLAAKMIVIAVTCLLVFGASVAAGWGIDYLILRGGIGVDLTLASPTSFRVLGGFLVEMILVAWLCFGLGAVIRSSAGGIGAAVGIVLVLPTIMAFIVVGISGGAGEVTGWRKVLVDVNAFLPTNAGSLVRQAERLPGDIMGPWEGLGVLGAWAVLALVVAFVVTHNRDV